MLLDTDRDKNIDLIGEKISIFCRMYITVGHRIQGESPGPLRLKYAVGDILFTVQYLNIDEDWNGESGLSTLRYL